MAKRQDKLFVVQKFIKAASAAEAIRKDRSTPVHEVWIEPEWKKRNDDGLADALGFVRPKQS